MQSRMVRTLKKIDDVLEVVVFDWALHPSRRLKTLAVVGLGAALTLSPGQAPELTPQQHFETGTRLLAKKAKARDAVRHLRKASKGMAKDARVWQNLGHALLNKDKAAAAVRSYQRAVEIDPSISHLFFLGYGYVKQELPEIAIGCYDQILQKNAFFYPAIAYRGVAHDKAGRYDEAKAHFKKALAYNPDYLPAHFHLGITYVNTKEYWKSIKRFEKVIELDPTESAAYYNIACCYSLMGDTARALEWLAKSVDIGFKDYKHMDKDTDLDNIRSADGFKEIRKQAKKAWKAEAAS